MIETNLENFAKINNLSDDDIEHAITPDLNFNPVNVSSHELSKDDKEILHNLEKKNKCTYNSGYVQEFLRCRSNPLYFIH